MKIGDKVVYQASNGKEATGVIHGIRKADMGKGEVVIGYVVDTGKDLRTDEVVYDERDVEFTKRVNDIVADKKNPIDNVQDAVTEVLKHKDLPKSKKVTDLVRQPKTVDITPENIRLEK